MRKKPLKGSECTFLPSKKSSICSSNSTLPVNEIFKQIKPISTSAFCVLLRPNNQFLIFHIYSFISKLTKQSNFFGNFFSKLNTDFFVDYDLPTLGKSHTPNRGLLTRIRLFESKNNDKFKGRNTRALPKPYWDLSYIYQELWGLRCEQSPDTTCECDTPIYYNVETQGGQ